MNRGPKFDSELDVWVHKGFICAQIDSDDNCYTELSWSDAVTLRDWLTEQIEQAKK